MKRSGQKPKNFPGRKQLRQQGALERLEHSFLNGIGDRRQESECAILRTRISADARSVRTKKDRSAHAKFTRT